MRITPRLLHVASLLVAAGAYGVACGGTTTSDSDSGGDGGNPSDSGIPKDGAADEPVIGCGGCGCNNPSDAGFAELTSDQACALLESQSYLASDVSSALCRTYCPNASGCQLDTSYANEVMALNPDGGPPQPDDGGLRTLVCPTDAGSVGVSCFDNCVGRLTAGFSAPSIARSSLGAKLVRMASSRR